MGFFHLVILGTRHSKEFVIVHVIFWIAIPVFGEVMHLFSNYIVTAL